MNCAGSSLWQNEIPCRKPGINAIRNGGWKMELNIVCIPGDGIGPEIVTEAKKVLDAVGAKFGHSMAFH